MANLLVTGAAGFIGANFVHYWLANHPDDRLVALDKLTYAGNPANLAAVRDNPNFRFVHGDIGDMDLIRELLRAEKIDTIVNFAAESHVDRSIHDPGAFLQTNVIGTHTLLAAAKDYWLDQGGGMAHRFHHVSTDEVYGSLQMGEAPFTELNPYTPNSPYSASKAASDHLVRAYHHTYGMEVTTSNCSNNYGPYQFPEKLIPLMTVNILDDKPLTIYGDGMNIRDWIYVDDHNAGVAEIIKKGKVGEVYNLGGQNEWTNKDLVYLLCSLMDEAFANDPNLKNRFPASPCSRGEQAASLITYVKDRPGHDFRYAIDDEKIKNQLGFAPVETFETGIRKTLAWYLEHESWWRAVMDGSYREWLKTNYDQFE